MRTLFRRQISRSTGDLNALREFAKFFCHGKADSDALGRNCQSCCLQDVELTSYRHIGQTSAKDDIYKEGYLNALISDVWIRSYVVVRFGVLQVFSDEIKDNEITSFNLSECQVCFPSEVETDEIMRRLYPLKLIGKNLSTFTLCARSFDERRDWSDAIRHASSEPDTRSLNIEGLNLECGQLSKEARRPLFDKKDDALFRRRKALYELRKETAELQDACRKHLTFHDWNQKLATIDNKYDRAFVSTQQEALRKATLLRQRKISTQLKIDMLKKQLPSNQRTKSHRPQLPECVEENRQEVETQLEELTSKLHQIEDVLGETERKAMVALQKLDIRRKEEVQILRETADSPVAGSSAREEGATGISPRNVESPVDSEFLPRICLSMSADDCSVTGSHRAKPTLPSSKRRYFTDVLKSTSSVPSLIFTSTKGGKHQMHQQEQSAHLDDGLSSTQDSAAGSAVSLRQKKTRRSPLRAFGNFVDSRLLRRWRVEKRTRSADLTPPSEHHESSSHDDPFHHHSMPESSDGDMRPRASTFTTPHANRLPTSSVSSNSDPFLQCAGDSAPNQSGSMSLESHSSGDEAPEKSATHSVDEEDSSIERTDETAGSKKPTPSSSIDNPSAGELRTEINPETLAEIEAFELMAQDYLRHHRQEQLTT